MQIIRNLLKVLLAGVVAVAILCGIFSFYSLIPVHVTNEEQSSDYVWPASSVWIRMTEGISWGRFDADGYNNVEVIENPDILILGSSHMEAVNVMQDENTAAFLNQKLGGRYSVYNKGISGHHFTKVCKYLSANLSVYKETPDVIVIETDSTSFSASEVEKLLNGNIAFTPSHDSGIVAMLQRLPFLRLLYHQIEGGLLDLLLPANRVSAETVGYSMQTEEDVYDALFAYIEAAVEGYDTHIVIFYHSPGILQEDGSIVYPVDPTTAVFAKKCKEYGITFIDMTERFYRMYNEEHAVPHGFVTGVLGAGHLNACGHEAIAQVLAETIVELEEAGKLCK